MGKDHSVTPKATLSLKNIGKGMSASNIGKGVVCTYKLNKGNVKASAAVSDRTFTPLKPAGLKDMKDVVLTTDYKVAKKVPAIGGGATINAKYELGTKKYQGGATWDGKIANKTSTIKGWYSNKDKLVSGEATTSLNAKNKVNVCFNQKSLLSSKYTFTKGKTTVEPSYNFGKKAPAVSLTQKVGKKDSLKMAYDLKAEGATMEYQHAPWKLVLATKVAKNLRSVGKPTLTATFEKAYSF